MDENLQKAMAAIATANATVGVKQKGGKKYTMVQDRVMAWRNAFGIRHGVTTSIERDDGKVVQVKAYITDEEGRVIGSGMAEEIRGSSHVNETSALENCETSALGRALASLGLHGGEYASDNELQKTERYAQKLRDEVVPGNEPKPPVVVADEIPFPGDNQERNDWDVWVTEHIAGMQKHRNMAEHKRWSSSIKEYREQLERESEPLFNKLLAAYETRKQELTNNA